MKKIFLINNFIFIGITIYETPGIETLIQTHKSLIKFGNSKFFKNLYYFIKYYFNASRYCNRK